MRRSESQQELAGDQVVAQDNPDVNASASIDNVSAATADPLTSVVQLRHQQLQLAAASGDRAALNELLILHFDRLREFVERHCPVALKGVLESDDLLQESYVRAIRGIATFDPVAKGSFEAWLVAIAHHTMQSLAVTAKAQKRGGQFRQIRKPHTSPTSSLGDTSGRLLAQGGTASGAAATKEAFAAHVQIQSSESDFMKPHRILWAIRVMVWLLVWCFPGLCFTATYTPPNLRPGDQYHLIFVTDAERDASVPQIEAYDGFVAQEATRSDLTQEATWTAVFSTDILNARDRLSIVAPVYNLAGELVASGSNDLWDGDVAAHIDVNQFGHRRLDAIVFTGSSDDGMAKETLVLDGLVTVGRVGYLDGAWLDDNESDPTTPHHFYGISGPITVIPEPGMSMCSFACAMTLTILTSRRHRRVVQRHPGRLGLHASRSW